MPPRDTTPQLLASLLAFTLLAGLLVAACAPALSGSGSARRQQTVLALGAELYAFHCSTCHGASGAGLEEARLHFPPDHRACERCHVPLNPPRMTQAQIEANQTAFSIGQPPAVDDPARLARFGTAGNLYRYLQLAMPRWNPGSLDEAGYLAVTAHLLARAGLLPAGAELDLAALEALRLTAD